MNPDRRPAVAPSGAVPVAALLLLALLAAGIAAAAPPVPAGTDDPFLWLEDVDGTRAMDWVRGENAKTAGVLERDARFAERYAQALAIAESKDRLPTPVFIGGSVYSFWQDADHVRGIWRRTSLAEFGKATPAWQTVLDLDAVASEEHANWFWHGAKCLRPDERRCLVELSAGGEDASTLREFDLASGSFVAGGFSLPKSKQDAAWAGPDEIYLARDWGPGSMTASGYPFIVKRLRRGQPLDAARELWRGQPSDVGVELMTLTDGEGHSVSVVVRAVTTFEYEFRLVGPAGVMRLALPAKAEIKDLVAGRLLARIDEDWAVGGTSLPKGALISLDLAATVRDPEHPKPMLVWAPGPRESLDDVAATRARLVVTSYENVRGRAAIFSPLPGGGWARAALNLPDMSSVDIATADRGSDHVLLSVRGFLAPTTLWLGDAAAGTVEKSRELPAQFDASRHTVEQYWVASKDGTQIPYFVVRPKDARLDGRNPTILNAYGGFQISETPVYSGTLGKLWLEGGGTAVLANIRGGGEFGPAWHDAGLKTHRQRIYDDFAAVAQDLIRRGITSPRHLGIKGGSNGGLLMGVEFNQHPELWNAVEIAVPLLDMLRYEQIAAGASWVGEYGSVAVPEERAFLATISPYQNLKAGVHYPPPFVWTTTRDDRVGPQHARKFAARLAALGIPYYYYEVIEGGHAAGANLKEKSRTAALEMTYFTRQLAD